ncbi:aminotransferase class V-fold PLP-dependent enzyme [Dongia soli]|uniref:Aminotransferase class V-fold PLP-dependent enzyme n=1 Tax=Dongia soli TaxID=600628 RepID=A0ABU5EC66_9PROT|nr:aminotransferase class V-fold PLP-dependent enzyme [Dongia soli]MDY0883951.1 aminotransferase class V-fold PLP-dependent enzyme [Dongia soli]
MSLDIAALRAETPGCRHVMHFNNAGASLQPQPVLDTMITHLKLEGEIGGYEAADQMEERHEAVYGSIAKLINCAADEVALIENATRAWDMAFYSLQFRPGDRILTSIAEYASNYIAFLQVARRSGAEIIAIPNDAHGQISVAALESLIDARVKLIAVTHVPTNGGLINPAAAIGTVARRHGIPFLLDACQSIGQLQIDVQAIGCDMLSATGRKYLRGPRGTGFLYVRRAMLEQLEPPFLDLHAATWVAEDRYEMLPDARRFENWESGIAGRLGLGAAVDYALALGMGEIEGELRRKAAFLRQQLAALPGITVHDIGEQKGGIVTFSKAGIDVTEIKSALNKARVNVSISGQSSTYLDMTARQLDQIIRASVHYFNTEEEIEQLCRVVGELT